MYYELAEFHNGLVSESRSWCWIAIDCCKAFGVNHSLRIDGMNYLKKNNLLATVRPDRLIRMVLTLVNNVAKMAHTN